MIGKTSLKARLARPFLPLLLTLPLVLSGCGSLFNLDLFFVGEQTSLEQQVLGTYSELGEDLMLYSSVRAVDPDGSLSPPPPATDSQRAAFDAMRNREYNRDDIDRLLRLGVFGEAGTGLLVRREQDAPGTLLSQEEIGLLLEEENADRQAILDRLLTTTPGVTEANRDEVVNVFANLNRDAAPAGSWVQTRTGEWTRK